jgi:hypothetical protein
MPISRDPFVDHAPRHGEISPMGVSNLVGRLFCKAAIPAELSADQAPKASPRGESADSKSRVAVIRDRCAEQLGLRTVPGAELPLIQIKNHRAVWAFGMSGISAADENKIRRGTSTVPSLARIRGSNRNTAQSNSSRERG